MVDPPWEWDYPRVLLVALAAVTVVALVVVASTSTAAFGTYNPAWDGASDFREVARETGADATVARDLKPYSEVNPNETVAVVLAPDEPYTVEEAATLRRFLERGGTVVVADDFGTAANPLLDRLGTSSRITRTMIRDERHHHQSPAIPVATNVSVHPYTEGVDRLTLNHASAVDPNGATVLVRTSGFAYADTNRNGEVDESEEVDSYPVVTVEAVGEGTLVVVGDPSVFINVMLEQPDNGAFVRNLFGAHEHVLLDYSHAGGFPPLALAVLVLQGTPWMGTALGLGLLAVVGLWARGVVPGRLGRPFRSDSGDTEPRLTEDQLVAYLERQHPDWDEQRVRRVVRGVISNRRQTARDE